MAVGHVRDSDLIFFLAVFLGLVIILFLFLEPDSYFTDTSSTSN